MTRAAVTVFIETDHGGDAIDAAEVFRQALYRAVGTSLKLTHSRIGDINITIHDSMEAGMAVGNGYLWLKPTAKAFPREPQDEDDA